MISLNLNPNSADNAGIDVTSVVDQIVQSESTIETTWQQQKTSLQQQAVALRSLQTGVDTFKASVDALKDVLGAFSAIQISSSQPDVVSASAQSGAATGVHVLNVANLATTSSYYTDPVAGNAPLAPGSFSLQVGTNAANTITIDATTDTLSKLADSINSQDLGVSASVITDATASRLALVSRTSGLPGDITIGNNTTSLTFNKAAKGVNASLSVDGVPITSASNTVTGVLDNVTLNLLSASGSPILLSVSTDTAEVQQGLSDFVDSYNSLIGSVNTQFAVNPSTNSQGILAGSSAVRSLQAALLTNITYSVQGNNGLVNLASIGIDLTDNGTLSIDNVKLDAVLNNQFADVKNLFQTADGSGFAQSFSAQLSTVGSSVDGVVASSVNENTSTQRMLTDAISDFEDRMAVRRQQLIQQYSKIDTMLRQYPLLMSQITGQLASLPKL